MPEETLQAFKISFMIQQEDQSGLLSPLKGSDLIYLYTLISDTLFPGFVSENPGVAVEKVERFFSVRPNLDGNNISGITEIRDNIFETADNTEVINAFTIIAPHTHWRDNKPIIYHYNKVRDRYIIGPHAIDPDKIYTPVSFVFYKGNPLPFEWADYTCAIDEKEFIRCKEIIIKLNEEYSGRHLPLGIAVDFRFKKSLFINFGATVEIPEENEVSPDYGFSYILSHDSFVEEQAGKATEQVAWHARSIRTLSLTKDEEKLLSDLRRLIDSVENENEKSGLLNSIEIMIHNAE